MTPTARSLALALVAAIAAPRAAAAALPAAAAAEPWVPDEVIVKFGAQVTDEGARGAAAANGDAVVASIAPGGWRHLKLGRGRSVASALAAYAARADVEHAQPNFLYRVTAVPNDPEFGQLWGFHNTGQTISTGDYRTDNPGTAGSDARIDRAWDVLTDCSAVTVAVIDSGVNYLHEDLRANMWNGGAAFPNHGWDFVTPAPGDADPMDLSGHGTHVAGTIGAVGNNGRGVAGVCWTASLMAVRVIDATGSGTTANIVQGVDFAVTNGAKVINMSLGGPGLDQAFSDAITRAQQADVVVVVAAGNDGQDQDAGLANTPTYPCAFTQPNLICVAALDQAFQLATFSNWGATSVDVGAPGTNIRSAWPTLISDPLTSGWSRSSTTGTGWAFEALSTTAGSLNVFADPSTFPTGSYRNATDDRVWKTFDLGGATVEELDLALAGTVAAGDTLNVRCAPTASSGADPFALTGGVTFTSGGSAIATGGSFQLQTFDLAKCLGGSASIGVQLLTDAATTAQGLAFGLLTITKHGVASTTYRTIDGTSMATPLTAGVAALVRSRNPRYTATDVVSAIKAGGTPVPALAGKTTSGNAVNAIGALAHLEAPTGLTATVQ